MVDVPLCRVEDLGDGELRHFEHIGYDLLLARVGDLFFCVDAMCTYSWADLSQGTVDRDKKAVVCPGCGGAYSLETGQPLDGPPQFPLQVYEVHVVGDDVVATFVY
jgi:nitrite reductase/ring-hydroxylating ferredoxin subunit